MNFNVRFVSSEEENDHLSESDIVIDFDNSECEGLSDEDNDNEPTVNPNALFDALDQIAEVNEVSEDEVQNIAASPQCDADVMFNLKEVPCSDRDIVESVAKDHNYASPVKNLDLAPIPVAIPGPSTEYSVIEIQSTCSSGKEQILSSSRRRHRSMSSYELFTTENNIPDEIQVGLENRTTRNSILPRVSEKKIEIV